MVIKIWSTLFATLLAVEIRNPKQFKIDIEHRVIEGHDSHRNLSKIITDLRDNHLENPIQSIS